MRAGGHKLLGPLEARGKIFRVGCCECLLQCGKVVCFFLHDVLLQVRHEGFESGLELGIMGWKVLKLVEKLLDLELLSRGSDQSPVGCRRCNG